MEKIIINLIVREICRPSNSLPVNTEIQIAYFKNEG